ncbi:MAG: hypothetical protein LBQ80_01495 [Clostridium sp.]|jgi:hypothetical protein|nr:hypothetical protein [Clostridium sp.]
MIKNDFEKSFSEYLNGKEYDNAEEALFEIVRSAFRAGWEAANGTPPPNTFEITNEA